MLLFWNDPRILLWILIVILILDNTWSLYLTWREIRICERTTEVPKEMKDYMKQETFNSIRLYRIKIFKLTFVDTFIFVIIAGTLELYYGLYAFLWDLSQMACYFSTHEMYIYIFYVLLLTAYLKVKLIPRIICEKFIKKPVEAQHETICMIVLKQFAEIILTLVEIIIGTVLFVATVMYIGDYFYLGIYGLYLIYTLLSALLMPLLIDPFFSKEKSLDDGPLRRDIQNLTDSVGFPISKVKVHSVDLQMNGNAFFSECCCLKRVVILDTLLMDTEDLSPDKIDEGLPNNQVVAVVAHELGHWAHGHIYKSTVLSKLHLLLTLFLFSICFSHGPFYEAVGFQKDVKPLLAGAFIMFSYVLVPYLTLTNFILVSFSRHIEYQADCFAYKLGYSKDLRAALSKLSADSLKFPISDSYYSAWTNEYPTTLERLTYLQKLEEMESNFE